MAFHLGEDLLLLNPHDLLADEFLKNLDNEAGTRSRFLKSSGFHCSRNFSFICLS